MTVAAPGDIFRWVRSLAFAFPPLSETAYGRPLLHWTLMELVASTLLARKPALPKLRLVALTLHLGTTVADTEKEPVIGLDPTGHGVLPASYAYVTDGLAAKTPE